MKFCALPKPCAPNIRLLAIPHSRTRHQDYLTSLRPQVPPRISPWLPQCPTRDFPRGDCSDAQVTSSGARQEPLQAVRRGRGFRGFWKSGFLGAWSLLSPEAVVTGLMVLMSQNTSLGTEPNILLSTAHAS